MPQAQAHARVPAPAERPAHPVPCARRTSPHSRLPLVNPAFYPGYRETVVPSVNCGLTVVNMTEPSISIVDRVELRPGHARAFIDAYRSEYLPRAEARGLVLDRFLVSPPVWIDGEPNTVTAIWTADGPSGWWQAAIAGRYDPESAEWWARMAPHVLGRSRSSAADVADVEGLCDV